MNQSIDDLASECTDGWLVYAVLNTENKTLKDWHALHLRCFVGVLVLFRPAAKSSKSDWGFSLGKTTQQKVSMESFQGGSGVMEIHPIAGWFIHVYKFYKGTSYFKMDDLWVLPWLWKPPGMAIFPWLRNGLVGAMFKPLFFRGWISSCAFPGMDHEHCVSARLFFLFFSATVSGPGKHLWNLGMALISCWFDHRFSVDFPGYYPSWEAFNQRSSGGMTLTLICTMWGPQDS